MIFKRQAIKGVLLALITVVSGCDGKWSSPKEVPGPVPLGPPSAPITRLKREKPTFEVRTQRSFGTTGTARSERRIGSRHSLTQLPRNFWIG